jgi:hypothetical protein
MSAPIKAPGRPKKLRIAEAPESPLTLTPVEVSLVREYRMMNNAAQEMIVRLVSTYKRTLPRQRPAMRLVVGGAA